MAGITTTKALKAAFEKHGSLKAAWRANPGTPWKRIHSIFHQAIAEGSMSPIRVGAKSAAQRAAAAKGKTKAVVRVGGRKKALKAKVAERHPDKVTRFIFTCAQNNTKLHEDTWLNLLALKEFYGASLHVSRFAYIRGGLGARGDKKNYFEARAGGERVVEDFWFDERITPYISDDRMKIADGLVWCGEANIIPTAARPLGGLETFTGRDSGIFPHVKIAMESIPASEIDPTKFNYTTGTITQRNYIQRKEGLKAEFHHCYGALLVEVDQDDNWWCRQLNADSEGTLYDLDVCAKGGKVTTNNKAMAIHHKIEQTPETFVEGAKWGDIHVEQMDPLVREAIWGEGGIIDVLRPKHQFMDDIFDMFARNHHEMDDPHTMLQRFITGQDSIREEAVRVTEFIEQAHRSFAKMIVVNSNHDRAIERWLKDKRAQFDVSNMTFWHQLNTRFQEYMWANSGSKPVILEMTLLFVWGRKEPPKGIEFLKQGGTYIICPKAGGGIDNGQHGDDGANGARGSTAGYARMGRKMNKGHDHRATIYDSVFSTGCCLDLKNPPSYQRGPSSASNSHAITYINGKRAILTQWGDERKAWADRY